MPLFRITVRRGRTPAQLRALADAIHEVAVRSFNVPEKDRFQIIEQREAHELFYDPDYMGVKRTDEIVFLQISAGKVRTTETKLNFYRDLAKSLEEQCGLAPDNLFVVINTSGAEDWSFGRGRAQMYQPSNPTLAAGE